ncbi:uncharacterized protein (TIGR00369 family) [Naumannella halotolerans]|uniref:Uncharacterized protein (TIGR00369 family) n=2 Tax=Naumannella halotolerans TaxID=993414 RepID=A0A4R7J8M0_9ACTN|nr:uncharacterized protein (TIGR00369 family) [Naumannella halotolerans]
MQVYGVRMSTQDDEVIESEFMRATGLVMTEITATKVTGYAELGPRQHQPHGIVHGGVYCAIIETVASTGAFTAVADQGKVVVGVHNATDFLRAVSEARATVVGEPLFQGRTQQLWQVVITNDANSKELARGQVRLAVIDRPS